MEAVIDVEWLEDLAAQLLRTSMTLKTQGREEAATAMLMTLKEASHWAKENLQLDVTAATLRSACVDRRLDATQENSITGRRGQPCEWKVTAMDLATFLTGKFRSRRKRSVKEVAAVAAAPVLEPVVVTRAAAKAAPAPVVSTPAPVQAPVRMPVVAAQPEALTVLRPRYKVLELTLQPVELDYGRHDIYNMRVIKKNIPRHAVAEKLATELARQAGQSHLSHQLRYVIEEYQSQPRRK